MKTKKEKLISGELAVYCNSKKEASAMCKEIGLQTILKHYSKKRCFLAIIGSVANFVENYQFKNTTRASKFLAECEVKPTREIIGYAAPYSMGKRSDGSYHINKGDIINKEIDNIDGVISYVNENISFPCEWVEKDWTPIYKKTEAEEQKEMWRELHHDYCINAYTLDIFGIQQTKFKLVRK
jgi:hypothetical protein